MTVRACRWCRGPIPPRARRDSVYCGRRCRQTAWRLRQRAGEVEVADQPGRFAYADPPYPGLAARYYRDEPTFAGEVDHRELVARLEAGGYIGWALSTSARALRDILPLVPREHRVCAWVKPGGCPPATYGLHNMWEPLIVVRGRQRPPGRRDWLRAYPARGGGELPGRKPSAFCAFLFGALGMRAGDELDDLFPGTGIVGRAWADLSCRAAHDDGSPPGVSDSCHRRPSDTGHLEAWATRVAEDLADASP